MKPATNKVKRCPSCGRFFSCRGDEDCWCEKVRIHRKEMLMIMNRYNDCLCPRCLNGYKGT